MVYEERIKYKIIRLFGEDSEIYLAYINGEKISKKIKATYNKKGVRHRDLRDKILLYNECRKKEVEYEENLKGLFF